MYSKLIKLTKEKYYLVYSITFILFALIIFMPFILKGNSFVSLADGYNEGYPTYIYLTKYFRELFSDIIHGQGIKLYDFSIGFGDNIIGVLWWTGLGELFHPLMAWIPEEYSALGYSAYILLKMYLAGASFSFYAIYKKIDKEYVLLGALTYCFSSYALTYGLEFVEMSYPVMLFPLIVYGIDFLLEEKSVHSVSVIYMCALMFQSMSGFYFLYIDCIFLFVYVLFKLFFAEERSAIGDSFKRLGILLLNSLTGVMMGCFLLVPIVCRFFLSVRTEDVSYTIQKLMFPAWDQIFDKAALFFSPVGYEEGLGFSLLLIPAVCLLVKNKTFKYLCSLLLFWTVMYFIPFTGWVLSGFSNRNERWTYAFHFLVCFAITVSMKSEEKIDQSKRWIIVITGTVFLIAVVVKTFVDGISFASVLFAGSYLILFSLVIVFSIRDKRKILILLGFLNVLYIGLVHNGPVLMGGKGWSGRFWSYDYLNSISQENYPLYASKAKKEEFARIDIKDRSPIDASLIYGNYSVNSYYSVTNKNITEFFRKYLISTGLHSSFDLIGLDARKPLESLLSVKHYQGLNGEIINNTDISPFGKMFYSAIKEEDAEGKDPLSKMGNALGVIILSDECSDELKEFGIDTNGYIDNLFCQMDAVCDRTKQGNDELWTVKVGDRINLKTEDEVYLLIRDLHYKGNEDKLDIKVNENKTIRVVSDRSLSDDINSDYLFKVNGELLEKGENPMLMVPDGQNFSFDSMSVYYPNDEAEESDRSVQNKYETNDLVIKNNCFSEQVWTSEPGILFCSVPYDPGWRCWIDGIEAKIFRADYGFSAVIVPGGTHNIEFHYFPIGLKIGIIVSIIGIVMFIFCIYCEKMSKQ